MCIIKQAIERVSHIDKLSRRGTIKERENSYNNEDENENSSAR